MTRVYALMTLLLMAPIIPTAAKPHTLSGASGLPALDLKTTFELNRGQARAGVAFISRGAGYTLDMDVRGAVLSLRNQNGATRSLRLSFDGSDAAKVEGLESKSSLSNYIFGSDPAEWITNVPHYGRVRYRSLFPGIDAVFYINKDHQLEYDFIVAPHVNPKVIQLAFSGADRMWLDHRGDLVLSLGSQEVRFLKPKLYQEIDGTQKEVEGGYVTKGSQQIAFWTGRYDLSRPLIIDPVLSYSTYFGGSSDEQAYAVATDSTGTYMTGSTASTNLPATAGAYNGNPGNGSFDVFVAKVDPAGALQYATYVGGSGMDEAFGIAIDVSGNAYITGYTSSNNFPTTSGAFMAAPGGASDAFVFKLSPAGNALWYSTLLGGAGEDVGHAIALDAGNQATVTGYTASELFPTTAGAYQATFGGGLSDTFVTRINAEGSGVGFSSFLGGDDEDVAFGIAVDGVGNSYVTGYTQSTNFPVVTGGLQTIKAGGYDAFVSQLDASGTVAVYSTFVGGGDQDYGLGVAVDSGGNVYVAGYTASSDFPHTMGIQPTKSGGYDGLVIKLNATGTALTYGNFLGGSGDDYAMAIALDAAGNTYVTGNTASIDFPVTADAAQSVLSGYYSAFVTGLNPLATEMTYSTYLGGGGFETGYGIAVNSTGVLVVTGYTVSSDFPSAAGAVQTNLAGGSDAFLTFFSPEALKKRRAQLTSQ